MRSEDEIVFEINRMTKIIGNSLDGIASSEELFVYETYDKARKAKKFYERIKILEWVLGERSDMGDEKSRGE